MEKSDENALNSKQLKWKAKTILEIVKQLLLVRRQPAQIKSVSPSAVVPAATTRLQLSVIGNKAQETVRSTTTTASTAKAGSPTPSPGANSNNNKNKNQQQQHYQFRTLIN